MDFTVIRPASGGRGLYGLWTVFVARLCIWFSNTTAWPSVLMPVDI